PSPPRRQRTHLPRGPVVHERRDEEEGEVVDAPPGVEPVARREEPRPAPPVRQGEVEPDREREEEDEVDRVEPHPSTPVTAPRGGRGRGPPRGRRSAAHAGRCPA